MLPSLMTTAEYESWIESQRQELEYRRRPEVRRERRERRYKAIRFFIKYALALIFAIAFTIMAPSWVVALAALITVLFWRHL